MADHLSLTHYNHNIQAEIATTKRYLCIIYGVCLMTETFNYLENLQMSEIGYGITEN